MKYRFKKHQHISYLNDNKKRITGEIIELTTFCPNEPYMEFELVDGTIIRLPQVAMYLLRLKNGHSKFIFEFDDTLKLEKNLRDRKLERILNE